MPDLSWTQIKFLLQKHGWVQKRQEGSHTIWEKNGRVERIAVGYGHHMGGGGLKEVFKRFGIEMETATESPKVLRSKHRLPQTHGGRPIFVPAEGTIGREIFDWRRANNVTADNLGKLVGCSGAMVALWENGKSAVRPKWLEKLKELHVIKSATQQLVVKGDLRVGEEHAIGEGGNGIKPHIPADDKQHGLVKPRPQVADALKPLDVVENRTVEQLRTDGDLPVPTHDEREFAKIIDADAVYFWGMEMESKVRKLEIELQKYRSEDLETLREKARKYDEMRKLFQ